MKQDINTHLEAPGGGPLYFDDCVGILPFLSGRRSPPLVDSLRRNAATVLAAAFAAAAVAALASLEGCPNAVEGRVFIRFAKLLPAVFFPNTDLDADGVLPAKANLVGVARMCVPEFFSLMPDSLVVNTFLWDGFLRPDGFSLSPRATQLASSEKIDT